MTARPTATHRAPETSPAVRDAAHAAARTASASAQPPAMFEALEGRTLMSAVLFSDGVLTLNGDETRTNILRVDYSGGKNLTAIANGTYRTIARNQVGSIVINGGAVIDRIRVSRYFNGPTLIYGGAGNDNILGGNGPDTVYGGAGNDTISGRAGKDRLVGGAGYDTLMGTRGVDVMLQGDDTPTDPGPPPVTPPVGESSPPVQVTDFGAKGDGVTNDSPALQAAIDAAPAGSTVNFAPGTYRLVSGLIVSKPLTLVGNGSLLVLDNVQIIRQHQISVVGIQSYVRTTWKEPVTEGQQTFRVAVPQTELAAGDMAFIELGQDPFDPYMPNFSTVARVIENTGTSVTIDRPIPYGFPAGATLRNRITRLAQVARDVTVKGFRMDHTAGTIPDAAVWVQQARNVRVEDISGRCAAMVLVAESQDVTLSNVRADVTMPHQQAGRILTAWQTDRVQMLNSQVHTTFDTPAVFLESWCRDTLIDGLTVDWDLPAAAHSGVLFLGGGSARTFVDNVTVQNSAPVSLVSTGGTQADFRFGAVAVTGPVSMLPVYLTTKLTLGGHEFSEIATVHKEFVLQPSAGVTLPIVSGALVRKASVTLTSKTGLVTVILMNAKGAGAGLLPDMTAGVPLEVAGAGSYGSLYQFNDIEGSQKQLYVITGATLAPDTKISVDVEYFKF